MPRPPHRFYSPAPLADPPSGAVELAEGESRHLLRVLRLKPGAEVVVFDGKGNAWRGKLEGESAGRARVALEERLPAPEAAEGAGPRLHVAASMIKRLPMEWMIEKLCELDAASLQPLVCERTVVLPKDKEKPAVPPRWEKIALEAAKQSGRNAPMAIEPPAPLAAWLARERPPMLHCFAHPGAGSVPLGEWLGARASMKLPALVAIGPEGGWTPAEVEAFVAHGFTPVGLGPLVLRAETAAVAVAAACRVML